MKNNGRDNLITGCVYNPQKDFLVVMVMGTYRYKIETFNDAFDMSPDSGVGIL